MTSIPKWRNAVLFYGLLRLYGNSRLQSAAKAARIVCGRSAYLYPTRVRRNRPALGVGGCKGGEGGKPRETAHGDLYARAG